MSDTTNTAAAPASPVTPENLIAKLAADELSIFLPLLDNFFTALQQPGVNVQTVVQDFAKEKLNALGAIPQAESTGIADTAALAQGQLHSLVNNAMAHVAQASATVAGPGTEAAAQAASPSTSSGDAANTAASGSAAGQ